MSGEARRAALPQRGTDAAERQASARVAREAAIERAARGDGSAFARYAVLLAGSRASSDVAGSVNRALARLADELASPDWFAARERGDLLAWFGEPEPFDYDVLRLMGPPVYGRGDVRRSSGYTAPPTRTARRESAGA